jgi:hypothetical protein
MEEYRLVSEAFELLSMEGKKEKILKIAIENENINLVKRLLLFHQLGFDEMETLMKYNASNNLLSSIFSTLEDREDQLFFFDGIVRYDRVDFFQHCDKKDDLFLQWANNYNSDSNTNNTIGNFGAVKIIEYVSNSPKYLMEIDENELIRGLLSSKYISEDGIINYLTECCENRVSKKSFKALEKEILKSEMSLKIFKFLLRYFKNVTNQELEKFVTYQGNIQVMEWVLDNTSVSLSKVIDHRQEIFGFSNHHYFSSFLSRVKKESDAAELQYQLLNIVRCPIERDDDGEMIFDQNGFTIEYANDENIPICPPEIELLFRILVKNKPKDVEKLTKKSYQIRHYEEDLFEMLQSRLLPLTMRQISELKLLLDTFFPSSITTLILYTF